MDNFDFKKYLVENNLGPFSKPQSSNENKILDADATLRALQAALRSGAIVTIEGEEVFKMPMINLATFKAGGKVALPRDPQDLADAAEVILVDGKPLDLIYKDAPIPTSKQISTPLAGDTSRWTDPKSIFYRGGD